jgi:hypothetical protein
MPHQLNSGVIARERCRWSIDWQWINDAQGNRSSTPLEFDLASLTLPFRTAAPTFVEPFTLTHSLPT